MISGDRPMSGKTREAFYITAGELARSGPEGMPEEMVSGKGLIYSSPATLSYNSPGAQGFGVKRAGLVIPESVMLLVAPACCGRNTTILGDMGGYSHRTFFLEMDENDLVTGRHLTDIPAVIREILKVCRSRGQDPKVVVICITCVDALLGTDLERVCRKAEETTGVRVVPTYMYALTREGKNPPMVAVRESIYGLLERLPVKSRMVNLLGFFSSMDKESELYDVLGQMGITEVRQVSDCETLDEFLQMGAANFNILLHPEGRKAAAGLQERLGMPFVEMSRVYETDRIGKQYRGLARALGAEVDLEKWEAEARDETERLKEACRGKTVAIGQVVDGSPAEMALALTRLGIRVSSVFANPAAEDFPYIKELGDLDPDVMFYAALDPSMVNYRETEKVDLTIGRDAVYYFPDVPNIPWDSEAQPFGYTGFISFSREVRKALAGEWKKETNVIWDEELQGKDIPPSSYDPYLDPEEKLPKGMRLFMSPFTPDQSGASSVLYEYGGLQIIMDAGGCVGNVCGYDEPRWLGRQSDVFSAGLRDLDAILGRDQLLIEKTGKALKKTDARFVALTGTPVPSVIATDYRALKKLMERDFGIPVVPVETNGLELYDKGQEKAYMQLIKTFTADPGEMEEGGSTGRFRLGVLGATPLDTPALDSPEALEAAFREKGVLPADGECVVFGRGDSLEDLRRAGTLDRIAVVSPSGLKPARYLEDRFGIPVTVGYPVAERRAGELCRRLESLPKDSRVLIIHQQFFANSLRDIVRGVLGGDAAVDTATWFMARKEFMEKGDHVIREECDLTKIVFGGSYDVVLGDPVYKRAIPGWSGRYLELPHYVASGELAGIKTEDDFWRRAGVEI